MVFETGPKTVIFLLRPLLQLSSFGQILDRSRSGGPEIGFLRPVQKRSFLYYCCPPKRILYYCCLLKKIFHYCCLTKRILYYCCPPKMILYYCCPPKRILYYCCPPKQILYYCCPPKKIIYYGFQYFRWNPGQTWPQDPL